MFARGWLKEEAGRLSLTAEGEAGLRRAAERNGRAHEQMRAGVGEREYAAAVDVLRRVVANLGGDSDLP
ncbi:hypothetical protein [Streptomyces sp. NPDC051162]|uniref:hypothetical protein n=1 Tax=unclassified Streptomyces TaxID=2593676 RepID=UPI00342A9F67